MKLKGMILLILSLLLIVLISFNMIESKKLNSVNVKSYGAVGDGRTDDTKSIQNAIDTGASVIFIPDGTYIIDTLISLKPKSKQKIQLAENATLKAIPNSSESYSIIFLEDDSDIVISGGTLLGDRYEHMSITGQWGHGIQISTNTRNIIIKNIVLENFWGDGIYIGYSKNPLDIASQIKLMNIICNNNRRQGISITHAKYVTIDNILVSNTHGSTPECGIDIEPNAGCYVEDVTIKNSTFSTNEGYGISMYGGYGKYIKSINITQCVFIENYAPLHFGDNSSLISVKECTFK